MDVGVGWEGERVNRERVWGEGRVMGKVWLGVGVGMDMGVLRSGSGVGGSEGESGDGRCAGEERRRVGSA